MRLQTLREPADPSWCSLDARPGYLRLHGRNHLRICHEQSLVAMRVTDFHTVATTRVAVVPNTFKQMAGLAAYYDDHGYYYLRITASEKGNRTVGLMTCDNGRVGDWTGCETVLPDEGEVYLRFVLEAEWIRFFWSMDGERWQQVGPRLNATYLSDDAANNLRFTGLFAALCCQDLENRTTAADFAFLEVHGAR
jgi:xylan 1,4-beta-xylosidase